MTDAERPKHPGPSVLTLSRSAAPPAIAGVPYVSATALLRDLTPPEYLVHELLERRALAVLYGGWGSGKTLVLLDWAIRIASGLPIHGKATKPRPVLYLCAEGIGGFPRRLAAWQAVHRRLVPATLMVVQQSIPIGDEEGQQALKATMARISDELGEPPALVIGDTLARNFGSGDENSNSDMSRHVEGAHRCIIDPYGATYLTAHHPGHAAKDRGRGASALPAAADTEYRLERMGETILLSCTKAKDFEPFGALTYDFAPVRLDIQGTSVGSVAVREGQALDKAVDESSLTRPERQCLQVLRAQVELAREELERRGEDPQAAIVDAKAWREECQAEANVSRTKWYEHSGKLVDRGLVLKVGTAFYPVEMMPRNAP